MNESATELTSLEQVKRKPLHAATVQDLQLELIRRRSFHAFDGERVAEALLQQRDLWEAVMMERVAVSNPGKLPVLGMVKLRDLADNDWNVDTLYILARSKEAAQKLATFFSGRAWGGMVDIHDDPEELEAALAGAEAGQAIVSIWWE